MGLDQGMFGMETPYRSELGEGSRRVRNNKSTGSKDDASIVPLEKTAWYVDKKITNELSMVTVTEKSRQHEIASIVGGKSACMQQVSKRVRLTCV